VAGATLTGKGNAWTITGPDPKAYNEPGKPQRVRIEETTVDDFGEKIEVPPCAVRLYRLETGS